MLRGKVFFGFLVFGFLVSWFLGVLVSWFLGFVVMVFGFILGFRVLFLGFKVSKIYHNFHCIFSGRYGSHIQDFQYFMIPARGPQTKSKAG